MKSGYDYDIVSIATKRGIITEAEKQLARLVYMNGFWWNGRKEDLQELVQNGWVECVPAPKGESLLSPKFELRVTNSGYDKRKEIFVKMKGLGEVTSRQ
jgi:hypothetical protein